MISLCILIVLLSLYKIIFRYRCTNLSNVLRGFLGRWLPLLGCLLVLHSSFICWNHRYAFRSVSSLFRWGCAKRILDSVDFCCECKVCFLNLFILTGNSLLLDGFRRSVRAFLHRLLLLISSRWVDHNEMLKWLRWWIPYYFAAFLLFLCKYV